LKVVILCGGFGTRMREETEHRPKPMVDVGGRPIVWHIMKTYAHFGFNDFVLCLGYRGDYIKDYFLNYRAMTSDFTLSTGQQRYINYHSNGDPDDFRVSLVDTGLETMTGGRIRNAASHFNGQRFCVTYGDGLADLDVKALLDFHQQHGKLATVTAVHPSSRFGVLKLNGEGQVTEFAEKPPSADWVSAGFFVFEPGVIEYLGGDDCVLERQPLERLSNEGELVAYHHPGFFFAMDTYRDYLTLNRLYDEGNPPWVVWN
jgi:glucose-1-phosphate cytidylyltransferase